MASYPWQFILMVPEGEMTSTVSLTSCPVDKLFVHESNKRIPLATYLTELSIQNQANKGAGPKNPDDSIILYETDDGIYRIVTNRDLFELRMMGATAIPRIPASF